MPETLTAPAAPAPVAAPVTPAPAPTPAPTPAAAPAAPPATTTPTPSVLERALEQVKPGMTWEQFKMPEPAPVKPIIDATGRAHSPETGKFVQPPVPVPAGAPAPDTAAVPAQDAASAPAPDAAPASDAPPAEAAPAPASTEAQPIIVPLTDRNGREVEITTSDPEVAETLRMYKNDGMRRQQYEEAMRGVKAEREQQQNFVAAWESTPEQVFDALKPELQSRLAEYVLATRFDVDFEKIKQFAEDPTSRRERLVELKEQIGRSTQERDQRAAAMQHAVRVSDAVKALVPAGVSEGQAAPFLGAAAAMITGLVQQGRPVTPENVPEILAPLRSAYGLTAAVPAQPSAATPAATSTDDLAAQRAKATATVERLVRVAQQRADAQAVAPAGAGPAPVTAPMPPKGASIDDVTAHLKQRFKPGMTWTDFLKQ